MRGIPARLDACVSDRRGEEYDECGYERCAHVFEVGGVESDGEAEDEGGQFVGELPDCDVPRVVFKAQVEDNLGGYGVYGRVEDPAVI